MEKTVIMFIAPFAATAMIGYMLTLVILAKLGFPVNSDKVIVGLMIHLHEQNGSEL